MTQTQTTFRRRRSWPLPTRAGWYYFTMVAFVFIATVNTGVNVLYFALGMMLGAAIVSYVVGGLSLRRIHVVRDSGDHIVAGERSDVVYHFRNDARYLPAVAVHFQEIHPALSRSPNGVVLHLPATGGRGEDVTLSAPLAAKRRGILTLDQLEVSTTFPFGLFERRRTLHVPHELVVYPRIGVLNRRLTLDYRDATESGAMTSGRRGGNDEFYGVREYRSGDNLRAIHWRSTARQGHLMIREMAANAPPQMVVVLNLRNRQDTPAGADAVERAIELAAALVCYGFFENFAVGLAIAGLREEHNEPSPLMGREARAVMLRRLARLDAAAVQPGVAIDQPTRIASRAQWVVVTLHGSDAIADLFPPGTASNAGSSSGGGHRTVLAMDAPEAGDWVQYLSPEETMRLLRERESN